MKTVYGTILCALCLSGSMAGAGESNGVVVLNQNSPWRKFHVHRTPTIRYVDGKQEQANMIWYALGFGIKPLGKESPRSSPLPPADWASVGFDDLGWMRPSSIPMPSLLSAGGPIISFDDALIAFRGKFEVKDPAQVKALELSISYYGGAAVYVNGQEVARGHLAGDKTAMDLVADNYPDELLLAADGKKFDGYMQDTSAEYAGYLAKRERKLSGIKLPSALLRKGVNVVAIANYAAPVSESLVKKSDTHHGWPAVGLRSVCLTAASTDAVTPNVGAAPGFRLWTDRIYETATTAALGDPCEPLTSVTVATARNGVFSGRFYVRSDKAIKNLKITVSELSAVDGGAKIPASAVGVRCAAPAETGKSHVGGKRFDALLNEIPAEIPVAKGSGAVTPVWLTLRTPKDAKPGTYTATVNISAEGLPVFAVPFKATVHNWSVPDPKDFKVHIFGQISPDTLAKYYAVPRWSDKHLELIARSMALMAEINSRQALVDMTINFYGGNKGDVDCSNEDTMVRWIKQADGTYKYDFSVFDRYLDMVSKTIGKPLPLRLNCWLPWAEANMKEPGWWGPSKVSLLDPATGTLGELNQPAANTPEFVAFWKPVLDEMRKRIEARGWFGATAMGANTYCWGVSPVLCDAYKKIWPDGVWYYTAHNGTQPSVSSTLNKAVTMPIRYADCVWTAPAPAVRGYARLFKSKWAGSYWGFTYRGTRDADPIATMRDIPYRETLMGLNAWGDFGVDFFPVKSKSGHFYTIGNGRGTGGPGDGVTALLAPGPDGALATERYEMVREGQQIAEAILFLQEALENKKLDSDLEKRVNAYLNERDELGVRNEMALIDRLEWDNKLLALAAEVAVAPKP